jgi:hypothetical protein
MSKKNIVLSTCIVCVFFAVASVPLFIGSHNTTAAVPRCVGNLEIIEMCKGNWRNQYGKTSNDIPSWDDLRNELIWYANRTGGGTNGIPVCPDGGTYVIGRVGELPTCSIGGPKHALRTEKN